MLDNKQKVTRYLFDDLILDVQIGIVYRGNETLSLPKLSYDLLVALVEHSPALLSQQDLMEKVWPDRVIGDETLKQRVKLLRRSLGDNASAPNYIEAVRGRGYRLLPQVKRECIITKAPSVVIDLSVDLSANDRFPAIEYMHFTALWKNFSKISLSILLSLSLLFALYAYFYPPITSNVLLADITADKSDNPLSTVNASPVKKHLAQTLTSNEVAFDYYAKGKEYYKRYRKIDNVIAIEFFTKAINENPEFSLAYAGLSQAHSQQSFQFDGEEIEQIKAVDYAYQAITHDNTSVESYKALGAAYYVSGWLSKSIDAHLKALYLTPSNTETVTNLGFIYSEQGKLAKAMRWHKKALLLNPNHVVSMVHTGQTLAALGHYKLAESWYRKAIDQQPDYLLATFYLGQLQIALKQYQRAENTFKAALKLYQQHPLLSEGLADNYFYSGQTTKANLLYRQIALDTKNKFSRRVEIMFLVSVTPDSINTAKTDLLALISQLKNALNTGSDKASHSYNLALLYAYDKQEQLAIRYLVQAVEQGFMLIHKIEQHPVFFQLKRFKNYNQIISSMKQKQSVENEAIGDVSFFK
ncbi:winged helix-turn-helix domain-containing protein [Colwellia sp. TT2012]|uniref:winged helix-turn-helix domain-containing protein n=1 Tax=Colwellia sp. TT2012 TaxID=1720342 RepID=UPI00070DB665|nr:winged helix-turn-helix domain-containing protein [Colwellia sp. TT2012]